jgi:hypothetical protein
MHRTVPALAPATNYDGSGRLVAAMMSVVSTEVSQQCAAQRPALVQGSPNSRRQLAHLRIVERPLSGRHRLPRRTVLGVRHIFDRIVWGDTDRTDDAEVA